MTSFDTYLLFGDLGNYSAPRRYCQHDVGFPTKATIINFNGSGSIFFDKNQDAIFRLG